MALEDRQADALTTFNDKLALLNDKDVANSYEAQMDDLMTDFSMAYEDDGDEVYDVIETIERLVNQLKKDVEAQ